MTKMKLEKVMDVIDSATAPEVMSQVKAYEFLVELREQIQGRMDALRDEIAEGTEDL